MPQSLSNLLTHLVFSTHHREPLLEDEWRDTMHRYIGGVIRRCDSHLIAVNSVEDHIHLLFPLPRTRTIAEMVKEIKTGATGWIQAHTPHQRFQWQKGYGAFSLGFSQLEDVTKYIANQRERHRKVTFEEEYRKLLQKYRIEFDERYVWD